MAVNRSRVFDDFLKISSIPFSSKCLIREIYGAEKIPETLIMKGILLAIERHLKHFHRPLIYFSFTDCIGPFFVGQPVHSFYTY